MEEMADRNEMHDSHDEWLGEAERVERHLASTGESARRIVIDPDEFRAWCEQRDAKPVANARSRFAIEALRVMEDKQP